MNKLNSNEILYLAVVTLLLGAIGYASTPVSEPFFNNDETRHVMTGVYVRDLLHDMPVTRPMDHAVNYYLRYPALGLLIWPPLFYLVEGVVMGVLGTSFAVARSLVAAFGVASGFFIRTSSHCSVSLGPT